MPNVAVAPGGPSAGGIEATQTETHTTPAQTGSTGTGYAGSTPTVISYGTSSGTTSPVAEGDQHPLQQCGSYQGSMFVSYTCPADPDP